MALAGQHLRLGSNFSLQWDAAPLAVLSEHESPRFGAAPLSTALGGPQEYEPKHKLLHHNERLRAFYSEVERTSCPFRMPSGR